MDKLLLLCLLVALLNVGCGDCEEATKDAEAFIVEPMNQECSDDSDCAVVSTGCADVEGAYCAQVAMSVEARDSKEWSKIAEGLDDCDRYCDVCGAQLVALCGDAGLCVEN